MLSLRNINPMVRSIGTMGAVAALVGGITFASLTSNTVALTPNDMTTGTASLLIGNASCTGLGTSTTGLQDSALAPGSSATVTFCLDNTGSVPLTLTASIPQNLSGSTAAAYTTLNIVCGNEGTLALSNSTLSAWSGGAFPNALANGALDTCTATATLSNSYPGAGGEAIPAFTVNFVGNQS